MWAGVSKEVTENQNSVLIFIKNVCYEILQIKRRRKNTVSQLAKKKNHFMSNETTKLYILA